VLRFLLKRIAYGVPILLGVSILTFATVKMVPGDPVAAILGPNATPQARTAITKQMGLDRSIPIQYFRWLWHCVNGNFGTSIAKQQPVLSLVTSAFGNTLILTAFAGLIAVMVGLALGGIGVRRPGGVAARICDGLSVLATSLPQYSVALVLVVFAASRTGWFPVQGMHSIGSDGFGALAHHVVLPAICAALIPAGVIARMFRSSLTEELTRDSVLSLRARGLSERRVLRHAVHNTLPSLLTIAGLQIGYLLGGVVFIETIFAWPGTGQLVYQAISQRDMPVIQAGVLVSAVAFVVINIVVDAAHAAVDPRIRTT
jgi:peptide/nickel transport system permease protein